MQLSWGQVAFICWGAAKGMHHLHTHHVIHRDLKSGHPLSQSSLTRQCQNFTVKVNMPSAMSLCCAKRMAEP